VVCVANAKTLESDESRATTALIESIAEIDRRKLYADLGFGSLWDFVTRELGLSESAAYRRIQAARLLQKAPEVKASLESGALSLSNAAKVQEFQKANQKAEKKLGRTPDPGKLGKIIKAVESMSQRQCEAKLFEISPEALPREKERIVSAAAERELKIVVSAKLYDKLQRIRGLIAHSKPHASYAAKGAAQHPLPAGQRVHLPVALRKAVWARSGGRCEFVHEGRRCTSQYLIQIDHIVPLALGGANDLENTRVLCSCHNLQQARQKLGSKMGARTAHSAKRARSRTNEARSHPTAHAAFRPLAACPDFDTDRWSGSLRT
jgi:hypothetical protein